MQGKWGKATSVLMAGVVAASLTACGKEEKPAASPGASPGAGSEPSESAAPKTVSLDWLTYQYGPVDNDAPIKKFVEDKFNVKLNIWYMDVTQREQLLGTKLASGEIPDFMTVYSGADLQKFYTQGVTVGYTEEELNQYMPNYKKLVDSYDPKIWDYVKYDGKYIGIPSINSDGVYSLATAWRQDWLEKVGITKVPETLEEYKEALVKFRNDDPDGNNKKDTYGMSKSGMTNVYGAYGVYPEFWTIRDGQIVWSGILPETKKALETLREWKQEDLISPEWVIGENTGGYWAISHDFVNGKIGVSSHGSYYHWSPADPETNFLGGDNTKMLAEVTKGEGKIALGKPPVGPDGKFGNITPGLVGGTYMAFGKDAADDETRHRIMQIWDTVYGDFETFVKVKYGDKGVHHENGPDGHTIVMKEGFKTNEEMAKIGAHITFSPFAQPDFSKKLQDPKRIGANDKYFKFEGAGYENAVKSPLPSDSKYSKNLLKLQQDTFTAIINGEKPLEEFDKFVEEWKSSGGDQLTKEANEWYQSLK